MTEEMLKEMRVSLKKEVGEAISEIGDVVSEVIKDYSELKPYLKSNPNAMVDMLADVLIEDVKIPSFVPRFAIKWIIGKMLKKYI